MISKAFKTAYAERASKDRKRGLTLMEVAMVLAIIGVVIAAALLYFQSASTAQKLTSAYGQLAQIQQSVRTLYSGQPDYTGLTTATMAASQALPQSMVSGTTLHHAFQAGVTIAPATTAGGANTGFSVVFAQIPQDACKQMLTKDLGRGVYSAGASTTLVQPSLPFTLPLATTSCASTYNDITWVFN